MIRKGKASKPNEFGKMVKLQEAENQIVTDFEVYQQRPTDSDLLIPSRNSDARRTDCCSIGEELGRRVAPCRGLPGAT